MCRVECKVGEMLSKESKGKERFVNRKVKGGIKNKEDLG